jgi:hypothetical protein
MDAGIAAEGGAKPVRVDIHGKNLSTFRGKQLGNRAAYSICGAGHERAPVGKH